MDGIIPLFKPKGLTSHDCVFKLRRLLGQKKIGHTGTLDPEVEGVLPICVGEGTKVIPFLAGHLKEYTAEIKLGIATDTEDQTGKTIQEAPIETMPSDADIERVLSLFTGEIRQIPPMYSAVKVKGKKLYEYAREGKEIDRPARQVTIRELKRMETDRRPHTIRIRVLCSKGTYIRTLCVNIGKQLGYPAHMAALIRTESDGILVHKTIEFPTITKYLEQGKIQELLLPVEHLLTHLDALDVSEMIARRVSFGHKLALPDKEMQTNPFKMLYKGKLLAIYEKKETYIQPVRVFNLNKKDGE